MQYLMILLVTVGVFVLMVAVVLGISYVLGALMHSRSGTRAAPSDPDPCAQCQADRNWHEALPVWKRSVVAAWWLANRYRCVQKEC